LTDTAYNIFNCLGDRIAVTGVLAGFSIAIATVILTFGGGGENLVGPVRYSDVSSSAVGLAAVLFLVSMEFFLRAKENNPWDLSAPLKEGISSPNDSLETILARMMRVMEGAERIGRHTYNAAIFLLFVGMFFFFFPFSIGTAIVVSGAAIAFEVYQAVTFSPSPQSRASKETSGGAASNHESH
jgi:hypothetical protein